MRLPRWLMIGMLTASVLLPLVAAGWWWVIWPEWTAYEYVEKLAKEADEEVRESMRRANPTLTRDDLVDEALARSQRPWEFKPLPRSLLDSVCGRQTFEIDHRGAVQFGAETRFTVVRGNVQEAWHNKDDVIGIRAFEAERELKALLNAIRRHDTEGSKPDRQ